jgi:hypothetical protein
VCVYDSSAKGYDVPADDLAGQLMGVVWCHRLPAFFFLRAFLPAERALAAATRRLWSAVVSSLRRERSSLLPPVAPRPTRTVSSAAVAPRLVVTLVFAARSLRRRAANSLRDSPFL